jgi:hypothetical protein
MLSARSVASILCACSHVTTCRGSASSGKGAGTGAMAAGLAYDMVQQWMQGIPLGSSPCQTGSSKA